MELPLSQKPAIRLNIGEYEKYDIGKDLTPFSACILITQEFGSKAQKFLNLVFLSTSMSSNISSYS
jgi:tagatose-1,6-bisphosphate aldolase